MEDKMDNTTFEHGPIVDNDYELFKIEWLKSHKNLRGCSVSYKKHSKSNIKPECKSFVDEVIPINTSAMDIFPYLYK